VKNYHSSFQNFVTVVEKMVGLSKYKRSTEVNQLPDSKFQIVYSFFFLFFTINHSMSMFWKKTEQEVSAMKGDTFMNMFFMP